MIMIDELAEEITSELSPFFYREFDSDDRKEVKECISLLIEKYLNGTLHQQRQGQGAEIQQTH